MSHSSYFLLFALLLPFLSISHLFRYKLVRSFLFARVEFYTSGVPLRKALEFFLFFMLDFLHRSLLRSFVRSFVHVRQAKLVVYRRVYVCVSMCESRTLTFIGCEKKRRISQPSEWMSESRHQPWVLLKAKALFSFRSSLITRLSFSSSLTLCVCVRSEVIKRKVSSTSIVAHTHISHP